MTNFIQITPFIHVPDIDAAVAFFDDILGFKPSYRETGYAYIERDGVAIRMLQNVGNDGAPPGNRRFAYYVDVRDVDALHAELKPALATLPSDHIYGPVDQPYKQRELLIRAPDGNLIVFGQAIAAG